MTVVILENNKREFSVSNVSDSDTVGTEIYFFLFSL